MPECELKVESGLQRHPLLYVPEECAERATASSDRQLEYLQYHAIERLSHLPFEALAGLLEQYSSLDSLAGRFRSAAVSFSADSCSGATDSGRSSHSSAHLARFNNAYVASIASRATMFVSDSPIRDSAAQKLQYRPMTAPRSMQVNYEVRCH